MPLSNNFDLLRLIFASLVVMTHCSELSGAPVLRWIPHLLDQRMAVEGFFTMSGCLVVASYERSSSLKSYFAKRARRILPLYWAVIFFGLVLGAILSTLPLKEFVRSPDLWKYIAAQFSFANFLHPALPGLFTHNAIAAVNGSLWTIKIEVMFYCSVPIMVTLCRKCGWWQVLSIIFFLSVFYRVLCERFHYESLAVQLPGQLSFFVVGTAVYHYLPLFKAHRSRMWLVAVIAYSAYFCLGWMVFRALGVSLTTLCWALLLPPWSGLTKNGDFSYGVYVFHWPVAQTFISFGLFMVRPFLALAAVIAVVAALAFSSWNLIERPFLRPSGARRQAISITSSVQQNA